MQFDYLLIQDPTCNRSSGGVRPTDNTTSTERRVEICESGFRAMKISLMKLLQYCADS